MAYTVLNLCETNLLKDITFHTQFKLDRPIRWVHVAELSEDMDELDQSVKSGDLLIIKGPFLQDDPSVLMGLIDLAAERELSCVLLYGGIFEQGISKPVIDFASRKKVTLAEIIGENPVISDITSTIATSITEYNHALPDFFSFFMLMDIIHGDFYRDPALFQMRAQSLGFDLTVPHQGLWLRARPKPGVPEEKLTRIHNRKWMECADAVLSHYFKKPYLKCNSAPDSMFLIPKTYITPDSIGRQIIEACEKEDKEELFEFWLGIGTLYSELESFTETMQEAQQVVEVLTLLGQSNTYRQADDILLSMLVRQERENPMFRKVFANNIQPLLEMDVSEKNDLLRTLEAYFECGENISQAADALYVHRNTMRSRLENISELTGRNLKDPLDCLELQLALHYYRINIKTAGLTD